MFIFCSLFYFFKLSSPHLRSNSKMTFILLYAKRKKKDDQKLSNKTWERKKQSKTFSFCFVYSKMITEWDLIRWHAKLATDTFQLLTATCEMLSLLVSVTSMLQQYCFVFFVSFYTIIIRMAMEVFIHKKNWNEKRFNKWIIEEKPNVSFKKKKKTHRQKMLMKLKNFKFCSAFFVLLLIRPFFFFLWFSVCLSLSS